ncbi:MAG: hypothetical protein AAB405_00565 [Patescibacteria group bacterium]
MDELQNQQMPQEPQTKENFINKKIIIIVAIIVALLLISLGILIWQGKIRNQYSTGKFHNTLPYEQAKTSPTLETLQDTTSAINNELDSIDIESIDNSFNEIDADLNNL